jgi:hypothetical protein
MFEHDQIFDEHEFEILALNSKLICGILLKIKFQNTFVFSFLFFHQILVRFRCKWLRLVFYFVCAFDLFVRSHLNNNNNNNIWKIELNTRENISFTNINVSHIRGIRLCVSTQSLFTCLFAVLIVLSGSSSSCTQAMWTFINILLIAIFYITRFLLKTKHTYVPYWDPVVKDQTLVLDTMILTKKKFRKINVVEKLKVW